MASVVNGRGDILCECLQVPAASMGEPARGISTQEPARTMCKHLVRCDF